MDSRVPRIGAWAGFIAVVGIVGYHVALTLLAGQRVSGTLDVPAIEGYYGQSVVAILGVTQFLVVVPFLVLAQALRQTLSRTEDGRFLGGVAVLAAAAQAAVILTVTAAQAALVAAVDAGESISALFRFWDVLYNSGIYALEATWVLAFGLAMREEPVFPRMMSWLSPLAAALLAFNVFAIWLGIPDFLTLPSAVAVACWLVVASIGLRRMADAAPGELVAAPAV
jgi:hypothetical protein